MLSILVVDDDDDIRFALKRIIGRCGYHVTEADSGEKALTLLSEESCDVVFCDLRFPGDMPGEEILHSIRENHPDIKVVMMSCSMDHNIRSNLIEQGASDGIQKPFFRETCLATIEGLYPPIQKAA